MPVLGKKKNKAAEVVEEGPWAYFQFYKSLSLPIFIKCEQSLALPEWIDFLKQNQFEQLNAEEIKKLLPTLGGLKHGRILKIVEATPVVAQQIRQIQEQDRYGDESIIPREGFKVYRYKNRAMMMYSLLAGEWNCGLIREEKLMDQKMAWRSILNRFLGLALAPLGMVGFWGVPVEQGVVVMKQNESFGEAIFMDLKQHRILTLDGLLKIKSQFRIMRLDAVLKGRNVRMSPEELLSFLMVHCTYFDYPGLIVPIRQLVQQIAKTAEGLVHPRENFKPRTDLSL
jgi:hypothetical protein